MTGRNWGEAIIDGSTLVFNVAGKPALRIPLTDVGQVCTTCLPCACPCCWTCQTPSEPLPVWCRTSVCHVLLTVSSLSSTVVM